jgi:hypothetical protein
MRSTPASFSFRLPAPALSEIAAPLQAIVARYPEGIAGLVLYAQAVTHRLALALDFVSRRS